MKTHTINVLKASKEKATFNSKKIVNSLIRAGADQETIERILQKIEEQLYEGISTKEIHNKAFQLLKKKNRLIASKYKLKKAIYELGPTGFPFERFIAAILKNSGYNVKIGEIIQGHCVTHEIDVIAEKDGETMLIECKFHGTEGRICDIKVPLYIHSRYQDIVKHNNSKVKDKKNLTPGWVVTNTRFTEDAMAYGKCVDLYLVSWDYPTGESLKDRIDQAGLYPITVSTLLTAKEKQFLLSRNIVLCRELINDNFFLDHLGVSEIRKTRILKEMQSLCTV